MLNAFTVDVEDYYQVSAFEADIDRCAWPTYESRVERNVDRLLDLLDEQGVHGTFFVLGWVAKHHPAVVRRIDARGHEIGCHSFWHRLIYRMTRAEFARDLSESLDVLQNLIGRPVSLFRAPSFSIVQQSLWALEVLAEQGIDVDSSVFPVRRRRYGIPNAQPGVHQLQTASRTICEFPPTICRIAGANIPVGGGGYFRLMPWRLTQRLLRRVNDIEQRPFMFYIHPWEIDENQPRLSAGSALGRFRHYVNLRKTHTKLTHLLESFSFGTVTESLQHKSSL